MKLTETPCLSRFEYVLSDGAGLACADAPRLYAWLLEQLPNADAERLHEAGGLAMAQHVRKEPGSGRSVWSLSLLSREANEVVLPVLKPELCLELHPETVGASLLRQDAFASPAEFIRHAGSRSVERVARVSLLSPLAFHQNGGNYVIYPESRLLLQSLTNKWNAAFPEFTLEDEDALRALENGIMIRDYRLRTVRFALKGNKIPGCLGELYLQSRLPAPLFEIWNLLLRYGTFSGAGIKTTLGMGGLGCGGFRE